MTSKRTVLILVAIVVALAALLLLRQHAAGAGPVAEFDATLRAAYADYRTALMQTSLKSREGSDRAMAGFEAKWTTLTASYRGKPPPQFADDPDWGAALARIDGIFAKAKAEAQGDLSAAHQTLEAIRDAIDILHIRNGRVGFSQRMNAFHHFMEDMLEKSYAGDGGTLDLVGDAAVLAHLAKELGKLPPPEAANEPSFKPMLDALTGAVANLQKAALARDGAAIKAAREKIKPTYAKLFVKFG